MTLVRCRDREELASSAADRIAFAAADAIAVRGVFHVAFSGGSTPRRMLDGLAARDDIDWARVHVYQVDERVAPDGSDTRNATMLDSALVEPLAVREVVPAGVWHMPVTAGDLDRAAAVYAATLRTLIGDGVVLDLVQLGLGDDGHTASLAPRDGILDVQDRDVAMTSAPYNGTRRMSFTYPIIERARAQLWLVAGADKRDALRRYLAQDRSIPAGRLGARERTVVLCDADAAP